MRWNSVAAVGWPVTAAYALAYFASAELGWALSVRIGNYATIWPPSGLSVAALLLTPPRAWPRLLAAGVLANFASDYALHGLPAWVSLSFCAANVLEGTVAAALVRRLVPQPFTLERLVSTIAFVGVGGGIAVPCGALVGALTVTIAFGKGFGESWLTWWMADLVGLLVFGPLLLAFRNAIGVREAPASRRRIVEAALFAVSTAIATAVVFDLLPPYRGGPIALYPFLLWGVVRFGIRGASAGLVLVSLITVASTLADRGPFAVADLPPLGDMRLAQFFLCITALSFLSLAAVIHERDRAARELGDLYHAVRQSERRLLDVVETMPTFAWTARSDGVIDFVNRHWRTYSGLSEEDASGAGLAAAVHPADLGRHEARWRASLASGDPFEDEVRYRRGADGVYRWFLARAVPLRDERGAIVRWYGVSADIDDRRRAEHLTRQVFESTPDAVCVVGRDYRYQRVNPVYERIHQMPAEGIVGMHVAELPDSDVFERTAKPHLDRCLAGEHVRYGEWFTTAAGRQYLSVSLSPLHPESDRVEAALVIIRDLTDHMLAVESLQAAQAELAHVTRVMTLGELAASIAHEVTQPLAAIVTNGDACLRLLGSDQPNLGETRNAVASIIRDATRAVEVVSRVRALLKRSDVERTPLDLGQLIREVLLLVQPEMTRHRIVLRTSLADDLPPVLGDRIQLQQVVLNLLTNAIQAMREVADRKRELVISARRHDVGPDPGALVAVEDTGVGFERASVDQLFEALYTTKADGLGMGLSISRSIILSHGGRLWATPNAGYGATFQFVLPDPASAGPAESRDQRDRGDARRRRPET